METFKAWRELIRAVRDIAIAIGGGDNKNDSSSNSDNDIKFWKAQNVLDGNVYIIYFGKVDSVLKDNISINTKQ